jgi:hypothetical protein
VPYAARRRSGEPISTAFVESAVNEIIAKRINKKQQMRWNRTTVQSSSTYVPRVRGPICEPTNFAPWSGTATRRSSRLARDGWTFLVNDPDRIRSIGSIGSRDWATVSV